MGVIKGYLSRNQIEFCESETVNASDVPESELSLGAVANKLSMNGGQGFFHCNCKSGSCKTSRCKCRKFKVLCNSRCHQLFSCNIKNRNFVEDLPMIIPGQFGFNCPSGFREEAF